MQVLRQGVAFWLTCVVATGCIVGFEVFVSHNLEPDFGDAAGNFFTALALYSLVALPAALCHGGVAFVLRRVLAQVPARGLVRASALSALTFMILLYLLSALPLNLPAGPLLIPCAVALALSFPILAVAGKLSGSHLALPN